MATSDGRTATGGPSGSLKGDFIVRFSRPILRAASSTCACVDVVGRGRTDIEDSYRIPIGGLGSLGLSCENGHPVWCNSLRI